MIHHYWRQAPFDRSVLPSARNYYLTELPALKNIGNKRAQTNCVFHEDHDPSLSINLETGSFRCFGCDAAGGDIIDFHRLRYSLGFREAVNDLSNFVPDLRQSIKVLPEVPLPERRNKLRKVWKGAEALKENDPVDRYLKNRGINLDTYPEVLRFHPSLAYWDTDRLIGKFPAVIAVVSGPDGQVASLHRTYLTTEGTKASVKKPKKLMMPVHDKGTVGGAVRLWTPLERLGVAEGIETALACYQQTHIPTWAAISAYGLANVLIPDSVNELFIFADNDVSGKGLDCARQLASRYSKSKKVKIVMPEKPGTDWADYCNGGKR